MPTIVVLGSCKFEPYKVLMVPNKMESKLYDEDHEKAYHEACKIFYPAIKKTDEVWIYIPDGLGEHTRKDLEFARAERKKTFVLVELHGIPPRGWKPKSICI
jgi:hypothetical protein